MSTTSETPGLKPVRLPADEPSADPPRWGRLEIGLLAVILIVAGLLRFHRIGERCFWIDEFFTVEIVNGTGMAGTFLVPQNTVLDPAPNPTPMRPVRPWWHILWPDGQDNHPPLFYLLTRGWVSVFGYTETGFRSHAAAWSLASITLLHLVLRWRSGVAVGLWAAALMALAEPQIQLAQNARSYPMFEAVGLWGCLLVTKIERRGLSRGRWWGLALVVLAMMMTHYVAFGIIATLGAYGLLCLRGRERRGIATACLAGLGGFVLIWGWGVWIQSHGQAANDPVVFRETSPDHLAMTLLRLANLPAQLLNEPPPGWDGVAAAGLLLLPLALIFLPRRREAALWVLWFAGGVLPAAGADLARHSMRLDIIRYTIIAGPAIYALLANLTTVRWRPVALRHLLPAVALLSCVVNIVAGVPYGRGGMPDWRRFGREGVGRISRPGDLVVIAPTTTQDLMYSVLYMCGTHYGRPLKGPILVLGGPATPETRKLLAPYRGVVVITDDCGSDGIFSTIEPATIRYFPGVGDVYRFEQPLEPRQRSSP